MQSLAGLELRRMRMITEVGAEQNTMTIIMMPSECVEMARGIGQRAGVAWRARSSMISHQLLQGLAAS